MKSLVIILFLTLLTSSLYAQQPAQEKSAATQAKLPPAVSLLSPAICGKGAFQLLLGTQALGSEMFEITCRNDGGGNSGD